MSFSLTVCGCSTYNFIDHLPNPQPYRHGNEKHSQTFLDQINGVHTNYVKALWSRCKKRFKQMNGTVDNMVSWYFDEYMWKEDMELRPLKLLITFLLIFHNVIQSKFSAQHLFY